MIKDILPSTVQRVVTNTNKIDNLQIRNNTTCNLNIYKGSNNYVLSDRIKKLNREWDTERLLETNAASIVILSSLFAIKSNKCYWSFLSAIVGAYLLQHALQGWCPPVPIIRKLGVRTADEINNEKMVLKILRGDITQNTNDVQDILSMIEKQ